MPACGLGPPRPCIDPITMTRLSLAILIAAVLAPLPLAAAHGASGVEGVWSGIYRCCPMQAETGASPGYTSSIRLVVEGSNARVARDSGEISEHLQGVVSRDGTLTLEGTGTRRSGGATWRYRYEGRFEGSRYTAEGAMLSANLATRLRECSMTLARMQRADPPARPRDAEPAAAAQPPAAVEPALARTSAEAPAGGEPAGRPKAKSARVSAVESELDFRARNDSATMEGRLARGVPHQYHVLARKGQRLSATLQSNDGARFDVYEPGSSVSLLSGGYVVQGARLAANDEGTHLDTTLPADGRYLLLVRAAGDAASYALDLAVEGAAPTLLARWWGAQKPWLAAAAATALVLLLMILRRRKRTRRMFGPD